MVAPNRFVTTREISLGVDDFTTLTYRNEKTGHTLYYHLYIPRGYEAKSASAKKLPLVVHFPSGDYSYTDSAGKYRGALFTHPDALFWPTRRPRRATRPSSSPWAARDASWNADSPSRKCSRTT